MKELFDFIDPENSYYELIVVFRYGETDRIDIDNIENHHITQFLKNLCIVL